MSVIKCCDARWNSQIGKCPRCQKKFDERLAETVQTAFVFAARYVHNRDTGGTLLVCKALANVWPQLSEQTRNQILRESYEASANRDDWQEFRRTHH